MLVIIGQQANTNGSCHTWSLGTSITDSDSAFEANYNTSSGEFEFDSTKPGFADIINNNVEPVALSKQVANSVADEVDTNVRIYPIIDGDKVGF